MKEEVIAGDYARVLHKLSQVMKRRPTTESEANEMADKAFRIRSNMRLTAGSLVNDMKNTSLTPPANVKLGGF
jgi:hypothetical protein